jgi:hypothetical protein
MADNTKVTITERNGVELEFQEEYELIAGNVPFDETIKGILTSTDTQGAIDELSDKVNTVATPGFSFGRSGNASSNSWLLNNEVPSNLVGVPIGISNASITEIWVGSEDVDTFDIKVYEHEGDEINLTLLTTVSIVTSRTDTFTSLSIPVTTGRQIATRIANGSAKNPKCFVLIKGDL